MSPEIEHKLEGCLRMTEALIEAMDSAIRGTDPKDVWRYASFRTFMRKADEIVVLTESIEHIDAPVDRYNLAVVPLSTDTIAMVQQDLFEAVRSNLHVLKAYLHNRVRPKSERVSEIADFLEANLRRAVLVAPTREKEVQDVIEQLLIGRGLEKGMEYDREVGRVKVSSKEVVPDFIFPQLSTALEVKLLKDSTVVGRVIDEMNADIQAYGRMYDSLLFIVYDIAGGIRDESEFRRDLETPGGTKVLVVKH